MQSIIRQSTIKIFAAVALAFCMILLSTEVKAQDESVNTYLAQAEGSVVFKIDSPMAFNGHELTFVDNNNSNIFPFINEGKTYLPLRFISESFGTDVKWDAKSNTVTINEVSAKVIMPIGVSKITVNGKEKATKAPAQLYDGRIFVPVRDLSEAAGYQLFYDSASWLIVISKNGFATKLSKDQGLLDGLISAVTAMPTVDSKENLKQLIGGELGYYHSYRGIGSISIMPKAREVSRSVETLSVRSDSIAFESSKMSYLSGGGGPDFSQTNVQVEGVDEADIVKTDGEYIYTISGRRIAIARAYPAEELETICMLATKEIYPKELYINGDKLVVIGEESRSVSVNAPENKHLTDTNIRTHFSVVYVYDIADKTRPKKIKELSVEGDNVTSRMIGSKVYVVTEKHIYDYSSDYRIKNDEWRPMYCDGDVSEKAQFVDYDKISYLPEAEASSYLVTVGIDLKNVTEETSMTTILGSSTSVYSSADSMYIVSEQSYYAVPVVARNSNSIATRVQPTVLVYKFSLKNLKVEFVATGKVVGRVLNQFSMDEYGGNFRIATTSTKENTFDTTNNMFVLDKNMREIGAITNIADGERIYSVRFMGKKAYMVTFRETDPLFVINLADPKKPLIEGELKIPGYSDYLHPYDDNHLIGFGRQVDGGDGIKISMFDVSNIKKPKELFNTVIPDAYSELNSNHKALLFSKENNIFAFPLTVYRADDFSGLYVYGIDLKKGFTLRGEITHSDVVMSGYPKNVNRSLYIGDVLYTVSTGVIKANNLRDLKEIKTLKLK